MAAGPFAVGEGAHAEVQEEAEFPFGKLFLNLPAGF
jgi:hypothetical protein